MIVAAPGLTRGRNLLERRNLFDAIVGPGGAAAADERMAARANASDLDDPQAQVRVFSVRKAVPGTAQRD